MATGYRSILRLDVHEDAVAVAESQLHGWLLEKKQGRGPEIEDADWAGPGTHQLGPDTELSVVHDSAALDGSRRRLYRYRESNRFGVWVVSLYAFSSPQSRGHTQTLVIEAAHDGSSEAEAVNRVDAPRLARRILETTAARDGRTPIFGAPRIARAQDLPEVLDAITDPIRTASVIIASSPWREHEQAWYETITSLTKQSVGVATTFIVDEEATAALAAHLPRSHSIALGAVRTFAPHVELGSADDGLRHRVLGPATLARSLTGTRVAQPLAKRHAESARRRFIERDLPSDVRRGLDILARAELGSQREAEVQRNLRPIHASISRNRFSPFWISASRASSSSRISLGRRCSTSSISNSL